MIKIQIVMVGKTKEDWLDQALSDYQKRLRGQVQLEWHFVKNDEGLKEAANKASRVLGLDPAGPMFDSVEFGRFLFSEIEKGGSRLCLLIGGPDGLPEEIRQNTPLISLSPLTFTHQIVRLVLAEQIYRACEIRRGSPYHK